MMQLPEVTAIAENLRAYLIKKYESQRELLPNAQNYLKVLRDDESIDDLKEIVSGLLDMIKNDLTYTGSLSTTGERILKFLEKHTGDLAFEIIAKGLSENE